MEAMAKHRTHSIAFKRQVVQEYLGGETMHGLAKRHDLSRNLIRIWVQKYEAGGLDEDAAAQTLSVLSLPSQDRAAIGGGRRGRSLWALSVLAKAGTAAMLSAAAA
jgi:transposase-like protein